MGNISKSDLEKLQEDIKNAPKEKKDEIVKILNLYLPLIKKQIKDAKKELHS